MVLLRFHADRLAATDTPHRKPLFLNKFTGNTIYAGLGEAQFLSRCFELD